VSPRSFTFTPANWNVAQTATVTGRDDCALDGKQAYQIVLGGALTVDPNYIGVTGRVVAATNADSGDTNSSTSSPDIHICNYLLVSSRQVSTKLWEYVFSLEVTNTGVGALGVQAIVGGLPSTVTLVDNQVVVGAVATGETVKSNDTITMRSTTNLANPVNYIKTRAVWSVTIQR
jgi:hypothetical protein